MTPLAATSATLVAASVWLALPFEQALPALGRVGPGGTGGALSRAKGLLAVVAAGLVAWTFLTPHVFALGMIGGGVAMAVHGMVRRRRARRAADARASMVLGVCESMASDLAAGQPPVTVLERAADDWAELTPVAVAARMGADVPEALRALAALPGGGQLRALAASWQVAHGAGSGLSAAIARAATTIRAERRTARLVSAELASARATARMLAVLPAGVLLLGAGVGGDPVGFLLGSSFGLACLAVGLALAVAGLHWLDRIADRVLHR